MRVTVLVLSCCVLPSIGTASAKDPVKLMDGQLPRNTAVIHDGSNGPSAVNPFSPSTAPLKQIYTPQLKISSRLTEAMSVAGSRHRH
jgi:hypothetical protein